MSRRDIGTTKESARGGSDISSADARVSAMMILRRDEGVMVTSLHLHEGAIVGVNKVGSLNTGNRDVGSDDIN